MYKQDPIEALAKSGADLIVNISASPYALHKPALREDMMRRAAARQKVPVVFVNLVGTHGHVEAEWRMLRYVIGGLKLTPVTPTFLQARDGILSAAWIIGIWMQCWPPILME